MTTYPTMNVSARTGLVHVATLRAFPLDTCSLEKNCLREMQLSATALSSPDSATMYYNLLVRNKDMAETKACIILAWCSRDSTPLNRDYEEFRCVRTHASFVPPVWNSPLFRTRKSLRWLSPTSRNRGRTEMVLCLTAAERLKRNGFPQPPLNPSRPCLPSSHCKAHLGEFTPSLFDFKAKRGAPRAYSPKNESFEELNEKKTRALSVLTDDLEQLALNAFKETTRLVGSIGDDTTRLLLYTKIYHRDEVVPHLRQGMHLNPHFEMALFQVHMNDMRQAKSK